MKNYIVYNAQGFILRTGYCPASMLALQASGEAEFVMEGRANDETDLVDIETKTILLNARAP